MPLAVAAISAAAGDSAVAGDPILLFAYPFYLCIQTVLASLQLLVSPDVPIVPCTAVDSSDAGFLTAVGVPSLLASLLLLTFLLLLTILLGIPDLACCYSEIPTTY